MKWLKSDHWLLIKIIYPIIIFIFIFLFLYFLTQVGGYNPCPIGEHEDSQYGRFGDSSCVPDY